jgi:hypothetical protein
LWLNAALRGSVGPDDFAVAARDDDPQHLVTGWPGTDVLVLEQLPAAAQRAGVGTTSAALPVAGDPAGLAGPPEFNLVALEAGEAVVLGNGFGLVPTVDARTVIWRLLPALPAPVLDPGDAGRTLRQVLVETTRDLARLDVASWQPEIPHLLANLRHRPDLPLPPGTGPLQAEVLERAALCLEIVALAREDEGGAVSSYEMAERRRCLADLDRAARHAVVACCSDSLASS